ncbi:hypothetical protein DLAC_09855 [Tieghemostelium lacteum]|uniref:FHA domain-containing protein n=1 Tax=Tieghemostelium lacteum TaxID=361077 RepID=A0A151Z7E0_TIELA|nr:hypothetical protein DLAC_09855 [Tieghemostelium lacteum]|eukprot:KYQ89880.1 hypothetical protein DLAC_09855 [Tieghemostelium lacteum]
MEEMIRKIVKIQPGKHHFILDRGFSFPKILSLSKELGIYYTVTAGDETVSLQDIITKDLRNGQQRTFLKEDRVYEFIKVKNLQHCSISNAFIPDYILPPKNIYNPKDIFYVSEFDIPYFRKFFHLENQIYDGKDLYELIAIHFNVDILKPFPNSKGEIHWTEDGFKHHSVTVLKDIAQKLSTIESTDKLNREELVKSIIDNHPDSPFKRNSQNSPSVSNLPSNRLGVLITKEKALGSPAQDPLIHNFYLSNYNYIDRCNDLFYRNIELNFERTFENDVFTLILFQVARASYAFHMEIKAMGNNNIPGDTAIPKKPSLPFKVWITQLLNDIQKHYQKKMSKSFQQDEERKRLRELQTYSKENKDKKKFKSYHKKEEEVEDNKYEYGKRETKKEAIVIKDKVDYNRSGLLDNSISNGSNNKQDGDKVSVQLKWQEPYESRIPKENWIIYPFKDKEVLDPYPIYKKKSFLFGRDRNIVDIPIDHPSCSSQHAVIVFREVLPKDSDIKVIKPYIIDLDSTNGTFLNKQKLKSSRYIEIRSKDLINFGSSTRDYVVVCEDHEISSGDSDDN